MGDPQGFAVVLQGDVEGVNVVAEVAFLSVRTKSEGLSRYLFAGRAASSGSPSLSAVWTWILEA